MSSNYNNSIVLRNRGSVLGNVYCSNIDISRSNILSSVVIAEIGDLHLEKMEMVGKENVELVSQAIEYNGAEIILISGDVVNDASDLKNPIFCERLREIIKKLANGRLVIIQIGNHDITTYDRESRCWKEMDSSLLKEALSPLSNVLFLDEVNNLYLKANQKIAQLGYEGLTHTNLNFVGLDLPWDYYFEKKENYVLFKMLLEEKFSNNPFVEDAFNILDIHTIVNFILFCNIYPYAFKDIDLTVGVHHHGGLIPAGLERVIPGDWGIIAPNMKILPPNQRGIYLFDKESAVDKNNKLICSVGNSVNVRVEMPFINNLRIYGPSVRFIRLDEKKAKGKVKVNHTTLKFR